MRRKSQANIAESKVAVEWLGLPSEKIPLGDDSADTVVLTYTLCTIADWQRRVNPIWKKIAGGCNLNRKIPELISSAGFKIEELDECYIDGPKIAAY
jgi:hypothetical protein